MESIEQYIAALKKLNLRSDEEIHLFLEIFFSDVEASFNNISDDDIFSLIHDFRVILFNNMNDIEKRKLVCLVCKYIIRCGNMVPQMVEYCGLIYKYVPYDCQRDIYEAVFSICKELCKTNRGIVAITTFIKYTNKSYSNEQKKYCTKIINELKENCTEDMLDTIIYTETNIDSVFKPAKKDVLLLIPEFLSGSSFLQPPLCFMRVKMQLARNNINADIFDNRIFNYSIEQVVDLIAQNYKYIIITSTPLDQVQNFFVDHRFVVFVKTCNRINEAGLCEKLIVVGSHGTVDFEMLLNDISPDMIVQGEYDECVYKAIIHYENQSLEQLPNNFLYKQNTIWEHGKGKCISSDWNDYPLDFDTIDLENYFGYRYIKNIHAKQRRWAILQASRGCPYECTFCYNLYGRQVRFKKIEHIINEWKQLKGLSCHEIFFIDQTFTLNRQFIHQLCKCIIEENIIIPWQCETRIDLIDEQTIKLMKRAGCKAVWLGIESFDEKVLKLCRKGYSMTNLKNSFTILENMGMEYHAFIMVGMEGETQRSIENTIDIIERYKIKLSKSIIQCTPRPGTEYYTHLPETIKTSLTHFWQIDTLRGYNENNVTDAFINKMVQRLLKISNEN